MAWQGIQDNAFRLSLLSVVPGREFEVAAALSSELVRLEASGTVRHFKLLKVFGAYDLLVLYETTDFGADLLTAGVVPGILHHTEVLSFGWSEKDSNTFDNFWQNPHPVFGFSFFKFKPHLSNLKLECLFVRHMMTRDVSLQYLGTVGWAESIIITSGETIPAVFDHAHAVTGTYLLDKHRPPTRFPLKTFTVVAIDHKVLSSARRISRAFGDEPLANGGLFAQIFMSCRPEHVHQIAKAAKAAFRTEKVDLAVGPYDVCVDLDGARLRTWAALISALLRFRRDNSTKLLATSVQFQALADRMPAPRLESAGDTGPTPLIDLSKDDLDSMGRLDETTRYSLVRSFYVFNSLIQHDLIGDAFYDLVPFMQHSCPN